MATIEDLKKISSQVRRDIVRMVTMAKSGHPGGSLGITDVMTTLYFNEMKHGPAVEKDRMFSSFPPDISPLFIIQYSHAQVISL